MEIPFHKAYITEDEINAVAHSLRSGWITMGPKTFAFESSFRGYIGAGHAVALSSATAALHLALKAVNLAPGDEVILPAMTFVATAEVVRYFGARPVFADVDPETHLAGTEHITPLITEKTKVVIPVHYGGQPCDMNEIMQMARDRGLFVIEDAAHALPARYRNRMVGTIGDITCFSFYATKTLATGEGGMAVTENAAWAERMRSLRLHGISRDAWKRYSAEGTWRYDVTETGYKYNTTDMNAALGMEQLKKTDRMCAMRTAIAERYDRAFGSSLAFRPYRVKEDRTCAWHLYPLRLDLDALSITRDRFIEELKERGIGTSVHFIPLYRFTCFSDEGYGVKDFPGCEWIFDRMISLPIFPGMDGAQVDYVIENVMDIAGKNRR